jgi:molecular chaperone GrpE
VEPASAVPPVEIEVPVSAEAESVPEILDVPLSDILDIPASEIPIETFAGTLPEQPPENVLAPADEAPAQAAHAAEMEQRLAEAEAKLSDAEARATSEHDAWLRAKAETENVRRRMQEDIFKASKFAAEKFASSMLPVKDSLEAALATESQTLEKLREGVELTHKQLVAAFEGASLTEENPMGQKFDPNKHQAIAAVDSDAEPNTVINVLQKGYLLHGRVIRPAMVMVAKAKA